MPCVVYVASQRNCEPPSVVQNNCGRCLPDAEKRGAFKTEHVYENKRVNVISVDWIRWVREGTASWELLLFKSLGKRILCAAAMATCAGIKKGQSKRCFRFTVLSYLFALTGESRLLLACIAHMYNILWQRSILLMIVLCRRMVLWKVTDLR